jgi:hypothetical protein
MILLPRPGKGRAGYEAWKIFVRGWNEITWSFLVDLRRGIVQMTKLIKSSS